MQNSLIVNSEVPQHGRVRAAKISVGTRFGRLVIIEPVVVIVPRKSGKPFRRTDYLCACDCGRTTKTRSRLLLKGLSTSCGCKTRALLQSGHRIGRLVVIEPIENGLTHGDGSRDAAYRCLCDCGYSCVVRSSSLTSSTRPTKSCGCFQGDQASSKRRSDADSIMIRHYTTYRNAAFSRDLAWELPLEVFSRVCKMDCAYCGRPPELRRWKRVLRNKVGVMASELNGVDRVRNDVGYVSGNVVTACRLCNRSKWVLSAEAYKEHCVRVASHKQNIECIEWLHE